MSRPAQHEHTQLEIDPEEALFSQVDGWVAVFHENERPLLGLAGRLDWRFRGEISKYLKAGAISGKLGECAYIPLSLPQQPNPIRHLILIGAGPSPDDGNDGRNDGRRRELADLTPESVKPLIKNLQSLGLKKVGVSQSDFGGIDQVNSLFHSDLQGVSLWITP
ncbi:MAG: hypothetical protein P4M08_12870 [Oligoflexia bacterium]|nr:hypothetical protein [Oligoflexia bacterium]